MKNLKENLNRELKNVFLVQGDDFCLYEKARDMIIKRAGILYRDFNIASFDDENFTANNLILSLESFPVMDSYRVIILNGINKLTESDRSKIKEYCLSPVSSSILVILDYNNKFDFIKENAQFVSASRMDKDILVKIIVKKLSGESKLISQEAVDTLIEYTNGYLTKIENELLKLSFYSDQQLITKQTVMEVVPQDPEYGAFELTDALSKKNGDKALKLLSFLEKDPGILTLISNHFRRMFFISISDLSQKELASLLGVKEYAITKAKEQSKRFSKIQLRKINSLIEELDFDIKSGKMLANNALYLLAFKILYV